MVVTAPVQQLTPPQCGRLNTSSRSTSVCALSLRLELLYQQMLYNCEFETDWATRAATASLLEIMSILTRGDVRSDVHKEVDLQIENLRQFQSQPEVDTKRLAVLIDKPRDQSRRNRRHWDAVPATPKGLRVPEFDQTPQRDPGGDL